MPIAIALYLLLLSILYLFALPIFLFLSTKKRYKKSIPSRFLLKNNPPFEQKKVWFHACSLGEVRSIKPILEFLDSRDVNISTITATGFEEAKSFKKCSVRFLPFEIFLPFWIVKSDLLVVLEAELWLMLFFIAKKRGSKTILLNARISDRSYKSYRRFRWFYTLIFSYIDVIYAQSKRDRDRLKILGAKNVVVFGNIKTLSKPNITKRYQKPHSLVIVGASTHTGEEITILEAFKELKRIEKDAILLLAPRHPDRFELVYNEIEIFSKKYNYRYSKLAEELDSSCDIILVDKIGELNNIYAISDVVVLGGAFVKAGGHNPIEPAYFNNILISGKNIFNQLSLFEMVREYNLVDEDKLIELVMDYKNLKPASLDLDNKIEAIKEVFRDADKFSKK